MKTSLQSKKRAMSAWVVVPVGFLNVLLSLAVIGVTYYTITGQVLLRKDASIVAVHEEGDEEKIAQFPVGVDTRTEVIAEDPTVDHFFQTYIAATSDAENKNISWLPKIVQKVARMDWYHNLASVSTRILVIDSGERREEVANNFARILNWSETDKKDFLSGIASTTPALMDGKFFPGKYVVARKATPLEVMPLVQARFESEVLARYGKEVQARVPLQEALTVASLLEREAYDFEDMRHISGVIWNRLFIDMRLQLDASLQYVKGSKPNETWWPTVIPSDKYLASAYNTYRNKGLPPAPIANPSLDAILAALNPIKTECMYYFHDREAEFHCSKTYEEHVASLKQYYGRGK